MIQALKEQSVAIVLAFLAAFGSYQVQAYRVDALERTVEKREANLIKQAELDKRVSIIETKFDYISAQLEENHRIATEEMAELKELIKGK